MTKTSLYFYKQNIFMNLQREPMLSRVRVFKYILGVCGLFICSAVVLPSDATTTSNTAASPTQQKEAPTAQKIPLTDLQRFTTVIEYIKNYYINPVEDSKLFENAIRGMLAGLDPHSSYFDTEEFAELKASTVGRFGGVGIEIIPEDGLLRVISPIDDTPAQRAGIQSGDLIVRLNDVPVRSLSLKDAIDMMHGEKGSKVILTIIRQGETKPLIIPVIRDVINVQSVRSKMLDENYGYIRISQFQNNTGDDFIKTLQMLKKTKGDALKGIILDLRNNPGGVFDTCVQVADAVLDRDKLKYDAVIVYTKGRIPGSQIKEKAHAGDLLQGLPIVVLINGGSASAAEIVAGALQDHNRAILVGTTSFGKGSVQTVINLKDKRGLKLTTALYYTPAGTSIQATGIVPHIVVDNLKVTQQDNEVNLSLREANLQGHLQNGNDKPTSLLTQQKIDSKEDKLAQKDYQLFEALNTLKAMSLMKQ